MSSTIEDQGRFRELEPIGVVDIGSNSVRLVIYEGPVRSPTPLFNEKVLCGLGRSVASTGRLDEAGVERALQALARFRVIARILKVKILRAIATAAARDASNGESFLTRGSAALGVPIQVLTGEEEAWLAAEGVRMGFAGPTGIAGDLGGGSLEVIDLARPKPGRGATMPLGGLRLIDTAGGDLDKATTIADHELAKVPWLKEAEGSTFYAVGGTWRALAKLHMETSDYPLRVMHGYELTPKAALEFCERIIKSRKVADLPALAHVQRARREVLPYGALVLARLIRRMRPSRVVFSVFGIREGLVFGLLSRHERERDPLISFCADYARLRSRSALHGQELANWTDALFQSPGPEETEEERRLRHAACLLSDIGWRAHPDYRGEQSLNVIAHAALGGLDHGGRIYLALSIYFRHVGLGDGDDGQDELSERLKKQASKRLLRRARILGAAVRVAHMISIGMPRIIDETPVGYEKGRLVLRLPRAYATLDGERLRRRFKGLASELGVEGEIVAAS